jgi:hypothetical protein
MTGTMGLVAGLDSPDDTLEVVMAGTMGLVAGLDSLVVGLGSLAAGLDSLVADFDSLVADFDSLVAGFDSVDKPLEAVMTGTKGLVADDSMGAVDMLTFELAGQLDDLEDISGM